MKSGSSVKKCPGLHITGEASLFDGDFLSGDPMVRLNNGVFSRIGAKTGSWIKITSRTNGRSVYRIARGCGRSITYLPMDTVMIDMAACYELGVTGLVGSDGCREKTGRTILNKHTQEANEAYVADWDIRCATPLEQIEAVWRHPDRGYQVSIQIALVSLLVGVLGFVVGLAGMVISVVV